MRRYKKTEAFKSYLDDVKDIEKDKDSYEKAARIERSRRDSELSQNQKYYLAVIRTCALVGIVLSFLWFRACECTLI